MADKPIGKLSELLPQYWGDPEHWDEARTMAAVAEAQAVEAMSNTLMVLAGEVLERLDDINRSLIGITKALLAPDELGVVESFEGGARVIDFEQSRADLTDTIEEPDDSSD